MRRAIPIALAGLALCGFGAGPFWGENKGGSAVGGPAPVYLSSCSAGATDAGNNLSCTIDVPAGTNRALCVGVTQQDGGGAQTVLARLGGSGGTDLALVDNIIVSDDPGTLVHALWVFCGYEATISGFSGSTEIYVEQTTISTTIAMSAVYLSGVNQSTPQGTLEKTSVQGTGANCSVSPASTTDNMMLAFIGYYGGAGQSPTPEVGTTETTFVQETSTNQRSSGSGYRSGQSGTTLIGWGPPLAAFHDCHVIGIPFNGL